MEDNKSSHEVGRETPSKIMIAILAVLGVLTVISGFFYYKLVVGYENINPKVIYQREEKVREIVKENLTIYLPDESNDEVWLSSPAKNKVLIEGTGLADWTLWVHKGDIFEINTGAGDDVVVVGDLKCTDVNEVVLYLGAGNDLVDGSAATSPFCSSRF